MKLARFDLYRYRLPFTRPLTLGSLTLDHREGLLLKLSGDDGSEGWGETAPLPGFSMESQDEAASQLRKHAGSMMGREVEEAWVDPYGGFALALDRVAPQYRLAPGVFLNTGIPGTGLSARQKLDSGASISAR